MLSCMRWRGPVQADGQVVAPGVEEGGHGPDILHVLARV